MRDRMVRVMARPGTGMESGPAEIRRKAVPCRSAEIDGATRCEPPVAATAFPQASDRLRGDRGPWFATWARVASCRDPARVHNCSAHSGMGRKREQQGRVDLRGPSGGLHSNPFAALRISGAPAEPAVPPSAENTPLGDVDGGRVEVRFERKGRGGKEVTVVRWSSALPCRDTLEELARACAKALGTGARVEGGTIVVQGRQVERLATHLESTRGLQVQRGAS